MMKLVGRLIALRTELSIDELTWMAVFLSAVVWVILVMRGATKNSGLFLAAAMWCWLLTILRPSSQALPEGSGSLALSAVVITVASIVTGIMALTMYNFSDRAGFHLTAIITIFFVMSVGLLDASRRLARYNPDFLSAQQSAHGLTAAIGGVLAFVMVLQSLWSLRKQRR